MERGERELLVGRDGCCLGQGGKMGWKRGRWAVDRCSFLQSRSLDLVHAGWVLQLPT